MMVLGGGALGRRLDNKGGAFRNGISVLIIKTPERSLMPSTKRGHHKKAQAINQERVFPRTHHAGALIWDFLDSRTMRTISVVHEPSRLWYSATAVWID